eukprot:3049583-Pleurochrysis_carterae.AAC.1
MARSKLSSATPETPRASWSEAASHRILDINEIAKLKATINDLEDELRNKEIAIVQLKAEIA